MIPEPRGRTYAGLIAAARWKAGQRICLRMLQDFGGK
jgi:hypothetical protein